MPEQILGEEDPLPLEIGATAEHTTAQGSRFVSHIVALELSPNAGETYLLGDLGEQVLLEQSIFVQAFNNDPGRRSINAAFTLRNVLPTSGSSVEYTYLMFPL